MSHSDDREVFDLVHLAAQTGGDLLLQRDLLDIFIVQAAELVAQIPGLDPAALRHLAHRVDGSARAIGAVRVAHAAAEIERAFGADPGRPPVEDLVAALAEALTAIEAYIPSLTPRCDA